MTRELLALYHLPWVDPRACAGVLHLLPLHLRDILGGAELWLGVNTPVVTHLYRVTLSPSLQRDHWSVIRYQRLIT